MEKYFAGISLAHSRKSLTFVECWILEITKYSLIWTNSPPTAPRHAMTESHNKMNLRVSSQNAKHWFSWHLCVHCMPCPLLPSLQWWNLYRGDVKCISSPLIACPSPEPSNININALQQGPVSHDNIDFFFRSWLWNCVFSALRHGKVSDDPVTKEFSLQNFTSGSSLAGCILCCNSVSLWCG